MSYKFVVVDDELLALNLMAELLGQNGHKVRMFHAGTSATIDIAKEEPDCLVTDLRMFGMNGLELIRDARAEPGLGELPVVVVTAAPEEVPENAPEELGIKAVIAKPIDPLTFADEIERLIAD